MMIAQQTHQRWINVETTLIVNVHQRCFSVDIWLKMKVDSTYIYQRCFNVGKTTLKQHWLNYVYSTSVNQRCFNVEFWLKMKFEATYVYQRCFNFDKTTLKKLRRFNVDDPMLFRCWYLVEKESWVNICSSALRKQH